MGNSCCSIRCAPSTRSRRRLERPTRLARSPPSVGSRLVFLGHIPLTRHISPSLPDLQELDAKVRRLRDEVKDTKKTFDKTEDDLKALQSVGQIVGEVLRQLTEEKFIVKATNGPRYVVGCRRQLEKSKLKPGTRVALDMTTLTIMR